MDKLAWTVARRPETNDAEFEEQLLRGIPVQLQDALDGVLNIIVTRQAEDQPSNARVPIDNGAVTIDALIEVTTEESYLPLDPVHELLGKLFGHVQGWRVKPSVIYDVAEHLDLGGTRTMNSLVIFEERLDGTTPEHFSQNWYIHAGHLDGEQTESPASIEERRKDEETWPGGRYIQNRILEPVTPTAWLVHGYTQLLMPFFTPPIEDMPPYERVRGEASFDRWPPRILQGHEYRAL